MRLLIVGCGYIGEALVGRAVATDVFALRRNISSLPQEVHGIAADLTAAGPLLGLPDTPLDAVVFCAAPDRSDAPMYEQVYVRGTQRVLEALAAQGHSPPRLIFVSSTAVYGIDDGSWVDEASPTQPSNFRGRLMLQAEAAVLDSGWPAVVLRCGGIYGPGRARLMEQARRGAIAWPQHRQYTNRIHRDDCAGVIAHLLAGQGTARVYNVVDDLCADKADIFRFLYQLLGQPVPAEVPLLDAPRGKRVSNKLLRETGYRFAFPTFREGYASLLHT